MKLPILLFVLLFAVAPANANRLIININPQDCIACQAALSDTAQLKALFQSITITFPTRFKPDSAEVIQKFPLLNNPLFNISWADNPVSRQTGESISMAYYTDNAGNLLKKVPLKLFSPLEMIGLTQVPDNHVLFADTIQTTNKLPASISNFVLSKERLFMVDNIRGDVVYLDWNKKEKTYRSINADAFTSNSYKLFYGDQGDAKLARNKFILNREHAGPLYKIARISVSNDIANIAIEYFFINGFTLYHFDVVYVVIGDQVLENFLIVNPSLSESEKVIAQIATQEHITDSSQIGPEQIRKFYSEFDTLMQSFQAQHPDEFHPSSYQVFRLNDSEYLLPSRMNIKNSYRFIGLYHLSDHKLMQTGKMLQIEKGRIFKESENYNHFQPLCGRFPLMMHQISNVLYDLLADTSYLLPLPLGKFDIGPEAMARLQPKTELYIYDVMVQDSIASVLYSAGRELTLKRLCYNIKLGKIIIDGPLVAHGRNFPTKGSGFHVAFNNIHSFFVADEIAGTLTRVFLN
ncbi:MAG: hypothetical protein JST27_05735 [Bacteroidetes bacterium]|nr:hypothetical protein [Bacteroidota bacterium]